jgi:prepilin-type N-terminal cleavage/methylation domain-containing protein
MSKINRKGFTLIELLIVMAIISIIAAVVFVALDPLTRFRDSRDAARWTDISAIVSAVKIDQVDNGGDYLPAVKNMDNTSVYMIVDGTPTVDCTSGNANCGIDVTAAADCVDLSGLVTQGYLGKVPVSPNGQGSWNSHLTGYTMQKSSTGILTVRACEAENAPEIKVSR